MFSLVFFNYTDSEKDIFMILNYYIVKKKTENNLVKGGSQFMISYLKRRY